MMYKRLIFLSLIVVLCLIHGCQGNSGQDETESTNEKPVVEADDKYVMQGKIVAQTAAGALMTELATAMSEGNVESALNYCNHRAYPILDSLSFLYKAHIRRTSNKVRNPKDAPTPDESDVLRTFEEEFNSGRPVLPLANMDEQGKAHFYAPIFVQSFCLSCHGIPGVDINEKDLNTITQLYPNDRATGYRAGDLRGMWSITFEQ